MIRLDGLPEAPLAAAAHFHALVVPVLEAENAPVVTLVLPEADHTHRAWRAAALGALARALAPARINAVAGGGPQAQARAIAFVEGAPGLTGQLLALDGGAGGEVLD
ncbi:MAG: hypothetical protein KGJ57_09540 [Sphingomonadales bacterium]|nr:hypothetical protein [Sphingomonadales bacterium]MDE2169653.1 hypothetical protein [Sphingomonadales bacterium]